MDNEKSALNSTIIEYLTDEVYFLSKKNDNLLRLVSTMQSNMDNVSDFIRKTYDLSGSFISNMKLVAYDSSNNIISYLNTDASGTFMPSIIKPHRKRIDLSMVDISHNLFKLKTGVERDIFGDNLKNTLFSTDKHIWDDKYKDHHDNDDDRDRPFHFGFHHPYYPYYPYYPYPHYPYYPYPHYPYTNILDDDYNYRDISLNHIPMPMPKYPISQPPLKPPVIYRDILNNMVNIESDEDMTRNIENYFLNPMHHSVIRDKINKPTGNPLHRYTKKADE